MLSKCFYEGLIPSDLLMCCSCELFLETCVPVASSDGFALGSECGSYFCECCSHNCYYQQCINL